jgi:flagellar basal-body rod modification protein FlgD
MTSIPATSSATASSTSPSTGTSIEDLDLDSFLKLMITELQNQDPLNPMENSEMLQQISQMRSISASDKLTTTLDAVLLGQNVTTASSLIGKEVSALADDGSNITGTVDRVTVIPSEDDDPASVKVHIGDYTVSLGNLREIIPGAEAT